jgi:ribosomal protein S18 acetylase RimI-like enzyme
VAGGVAGIYNICTVPTARGRGIASAMTAATMQRARAAGFPFIVLQSTDMAVNLYRALGFAEVCTFDYYVLE